MKNVKLFILVFGLFLANSMVFGQDYEVPEDYSFETEEDYRDAEDDIVECVDFLEQTPYNEQADKRKEASAFLLVWITGAPDVTIEVGMPLIDLCEDNAMLTIIYFGAFSKYVINNPSAKDGKYAGAKAMIKFYQDNLNKGIVKNKKMEKLIKTQNKGNLEKWANDNL